jgi:hypothetical protein
LTYDRDAPMVQEPHGSQHAGDPQPSPANSDR